jgi:predicted aspartyl protease
MRLLLLIFSALSLLAWIPFLKGSASGSEQHAPTDLDGYLANLGYQGIAFKRNERNQPLIEAELGGRHHLLLADTGCSMTTLEPQGAASLKTLGDLGVTLQDSFLGSITNSHVALMDKLVIGRAQFLNQPAWVENLDMDFIRLEFDGILGLDFFFRNFCLIDCYRHKLYVRGKALGPEQTQAFEESLHRSGFVDVPLQVEGLISVEAKVEGQPVRLLVDTGDSVSVIDESLASRLKLSSVKNEDPAEGSLIRREVSANLVGFNRIGSHKVWIAMLREMSIGPRRWKNASYGVTNLKAWKLLDPDHPEKGMQGIFGGELLGKRGALIDFCNSKLWLRSDKQLSK